MSIITINYNGIDDTCELIESIPSDDISTEVIVVDNASDNDEASEIERRYPHVIVVRSRENLGFAGGNNLGYAHSHGEFVFYVNNDTVIGKSGIKPLVDRIKSNLRIGVVCPKIKFHGEPKLIQYAGYTELSSITLRNKTVGSCEVDCGQYDASHTTAYAHGAAMLVRRKAIEEVGLMPECYFLYYEEIDWSLMMRRAGYEIWYEPAATIYHKESSSIGRASPTKAFYMARNRLLLARRNGKVPTKYLSYLYVSCTIILKDYLLERLKGRGDVAKASMGGLRSFWKQ